jgi:hypothetical protein
MAWWGVERMRRTASRPSSVHRADVPVGDVTSPDLRTAGSTPPPASQVEGRRARRHGAGWGIRTLLVGGLAGAAWLLTGAAAQAAEQHTPADAAQRGSSAVSFVDGLGTGVDELRAGLSTVDTLRDSVTNRTTTTSTRPAHQPSGDSGPVDSIAGDLLDASGGVPGVAKVLAAPFRLIDGPARTTAVLAAVRDADPIVRRLRPVTDLLQTAEPATAAMSDADLTALAFAPARPPAPATSVLTADGATTEILPAVATAGESGGMLALQRFAAAHLPDALSTLTGADPAPTGPEPAPLQAHLGAVSGASTAGSGAPSDGGTATVPSSVVDSVVADHRLPVTTDVEVHGVLVEDPTVSPD